MPPRYCSAAAVVLTYGLMVGCACAPTTATQTAEQEVRAVEERWLAGESQPQVVDSILADDFVHVLPGGFIDRSQHLDYLRQHPGAFPGEKRFEELRVRVYGNTAVATGIVAAERGAGAAPRRTEFTDVFVRRGAKWLAVNAQELALP